jgi:hypothetical protein
MARAPKAKKPKAQGKHAGGAPRTKTPKTWTKAQLAEIDRLAEAQCKDTTIAERMGTDLDTFRREFVKRTRRKRAEGKAQLYLAQHAKALAGDTVMLIWCGKQHLEQTDRQDLQHGVQVQLLPPVVTILSPKPQE